MKYCTKGENEKFGKIDFAIGCDVTPEFQKAVAEVPESSFQPFYKVSVLINKPADSHSRTFTLAVGADIGSSSIF
ncbi:MAG: hypothetical protein ACE5IH_06995 [Thermodesulfobacteriota bacterium]